MLSALGISVLGARNAALRNLVAEIPLRSWQTCWAIATTAPSTVRNGQVIDGLDTSHSGKVRTLFAA
jgi:hypothetical protein